MHAHNNTLDTLNTMNRRLIYNVDEYKLTIMKCIWEDMRRFMLGCAEWEQMCALYIHYQYIDGDYLGFYEHSCDVLGDFEHCELASWIDMLQRQHAITRSAMTWFFETQTCECE